MPQPAQPNSHQRRWAANLRAARLSAHLTQSKLARLLDIDQQNISRWENGRAVPRDDMKFRLAEFFGVAAADLFPWDPGNDDANGDEGQAA